MNQALEHYQSVIVTFAVMLVISAIIAYIVAVKFGGKTKAKRTQLFTIVGLILVVSSAFIAQFLLAHS